MNNSIQEKEPESPVLTLDGLEENKTNTSHF